MRSAFDGHIDEIPFILVDNFENDLNKSAYFLSHFHGDHVFGIHEDLLRARLKRNNVFIYGSKVTIAIINETCPQLRPHLKVLDLGSNIISIKNNDEEVFLSVTMLPAGHSLGSVMYLFEYNKQKILYTGDFRISRNSVKKYNHLHRKGQPIHLDVLYVDTTFQNVPMFPKRSEVVRNVVIHIRNWLNGHDNRRVLLITSAGYGYEYVCNEIYKETNIKTYVGESYWRIYSQFPKEMYGVTDNQDSPIHLRTKYTCKEQPNPLELQIYFSAYKWGINKQNILEDYINIDENRIEVCFSTHCGRDELRYFINYFNPKKIVGFPEPYDPKDIDNVLKDCLIDNSLPVLKISPKKRKIAVEKNSAKRVNKRIIEDAFEW